MADTTLTLSEPTKDRLADYRHPDHGSWTEVLNGMMEMLPTVEEVKDGCGHCGEKPWADKPSEELSGFIQWFNHEVNGTTFYTATYYCSAECVNAVDEMAKKYVPEHPDLVRVGGLDELATEFEGASFYLDGDVTEVGVPLPGAFSGTNTYGEEYDYHGEPVYVKNEGDWIHSGVVEDIIHEESHTALLLARDYDVEMANHPDEERRAEYEEE